MNQVPWDVVISRILQFLPFLIPVLDWYRRRRGDRRTERFMNGLTVAYLEMSKELAKGKRLTRKFTEDFLRKGLVKREQPGIVRVRMG